jgi:hypothetical protein
MGTLGELEGSAWHGTAELWLDPLGNEVSRSDCTLSIDGNVVRYTWSHEGKSHEGSITLRDDGASFIDTFHSPEPMSFRRLPGTQGFFQLHGVYGPDSDWGWRIGLSLRSPSSELVLQMTNVTPWGEEGRAVRMTLTR